MLELSNRIISLIESSRTRVANYVNSTMVFTYFEVGKLIIEEFQNGEERAKYGDNLLNSISIDLKSKGLKGFSVQNLERMRNFYLTYSNSSNELRNSGLFQKSSICFKVSNHSSIEGCF